MLMKDIGEEVAVMGDLPLPAEVERIRADVPPRRARRWRSTPTSSTASCATSPAILDEDGVLPAGELLGAGRATACTSTRASTRSWPGGRGVRPAAADVPAQLPQPAAAAQHPADGRPDRPGGVADLRRRAGQPDRPSAGPGVTICRDSFGIPHVSGGDVLELAFEQGRATAIDRALAAGDRAAARRGTDRRAGRRGRGRVGRLRPPGPDRGDRAAGVRGGGSGRRRSS